MGFCTDKTIVIMNEAIRNLCIQWLRSSGADMNGVHPNSHLSFYELIHQVLEDQYALTIDDINTLIHDVYPNIDVQSEICTDFVNKWYIIYEHIKAYTDNYSI